MNSLIIMDFSLSPPDFYSWFAFYVKILCLALHLHSKLSLSLIVWIDRLIIDSEKSPPQDYRNFWAKDEIWKPRPKNCSPRYTISIVLSLSLFPLFDLTNYKWKTKSSHFISISMWISWESEISFDFWQVAMVTGPWRSSWILSTYPHCFWPWRGTQLTCYFPPRTPVPVPLSAGE